MSNFAQLAKHDLLSRLQKSYEIGQILSFSQARSRNKAEIWENQLKSWSNNYPSTEFDSPLVWLQIFGLREILAEKMIGGGEGGGEGGPGGGGEFFVENGVNLAKGFIKMGFLDCTDGVLIKILEKRPKDYFSWVRKYIKMVVFFNFLK